MKKVTTPAINVAKSISVEKAIDLSIAQGAKANLSHWLVGYNKRTSDKFSSSEIFYQSFPALSLSGQRDTIQRIKDYKVINFINKQDNILNIGSNCGFLDIHISKLCNSIVGIEPIEKLTVMQAVIVDELRIDNIKIINSSFPVKSLEKERFEVIFSLAIHHWIKKPLAEYLDDIIKVLKPKGKILIESHRLANDKPHPKKVTSHYKKHLKDYNAIKKYLTNKDNKFNIIFEGETKGDFDYCKRMFAWFQGK
jgi:SAM-dependent methyltransferase